MRSSACRATRSTGRCRKSRLSPLRYTQTRWQTRWLCFQRRPARPTSREDRARQGRWVGRKVSSIANTTLPCQGRRSPRKLTPRLVDARHACGPESIAAINLKSVVTFYSPHFG
eukprot:2438996-Pleurochrysis_carterae.AAC.4